MKSSKDIINLIKEKRLELNMSQRELARITGVSHSAISRYEKYERDFPINDAPLFARALNMDLNELIGLETTKPTLTQSEQRLLNNYNSTTDKGKSRIMTTSEEMVELYPIIDRDEMLDYLIKNGIQEAALYGKNINDLSDEQLAFVYKSLREDE